MIEESEHVCRFEGWLPRCSGCGQYWESGQCQETVERVEVIGRVGGRMFCVYVEAGVVLDYQDGGRTLKIFVGEELSPDEAIERWRPRPPSSSGAKTA